MSTTSEQAKLQRIADELEIRNLVSRIFLLADQAPDLDAYLDCFSEDAIWEARGTEADRVAQVHQNSRLVGREALRADREHVRGSGHQGPGSGTYHVSTTLEVRVGDDDTAEAESHWLFVRRDDSGPQLSAVGSYFDRFVRSEHGWKLSHRQFF